MESSRAVAVVLLGAPGSGKTVLADALLSAVGAPPLAGAGPGRLAAATYELGGTRVALLDPPGDPELAGGLHAALRTADVALLVLSPVQGVDPRTVALWDSLEHLPRLVVLSQLDRPGADADEAVAVCQRVLGEGVLPLQLPLHDDDGSVGGLLDLLHLTVSERGRRRPPEPEHVTLVEGLRGDLLEAVLTGSDDEEMFAGFLGDVEPAPAALSRELARAVVRADVQPVLVSVPARGVGLVELAELLASLVPDRLEVPAATSPDGTPLDVDRAGLLAEVVTPGLVRVWSGRVVPGQAVLVDGAAATWDGPAAGAGEVVAAPVRRPGAVLSDQPAVLAPWPAPSAQFPVGVPDDAGLTERVDEDPVARLETDPRTGQLLLWTYGPAHAEQLLAGLPSAPVRLPPGTRPVAVRVRVPAWAERAVRSDLTARSGEVVAAGTDDAGVALDARLPPSEAVGYSLALGRASAHTGTFERVPVR